MQGALVEVKRQLADEDNVSKYVSFRFPTGCTWTFHDNSKPSCLDDVFKFTSTCCCRRLKTSRETAKRERDKVAAEVQKAEQRLKSAGWERGQAERLEELLSEMHDLEQQLGQIVPEEERRLREIARLEAEIVRLEQRKRMGHRWTFLYDLD